MRFALFFIVLNHLTCHNHFFSVHNIFGLTGTFIPNFKPISQNITTPIDLSLPRLANFYIVLRSRPVWITAVILRNNFFLWILASNPFKTIYIFSFLPFIRLIELNYLSFFLFYNLSDLKIFAIFRSTVEQFIKSWTTKNV